MRQNFRYLPLCLFLPLLAACSSPDQQPSVYDPAADSLRFSGETHFRNIRQLTFGGNNAEAYWSFDDKQLIFQSDWAKINSQGCDQIFVMNADGTPMPSGKQYDLASTGKGRTTCSYFLANGKIVYASTHEGSHECPPTLPFNPRRYVWPIYESYDIYIANPDGSDAEVLIGGPGYDAEPTVSPDGKQIIYTSTRSGDLELWRYDLESGEDIQITSEIGYDGGAFFSRDSKMIVWRASRPQGNAAEEYMDLLSQNLVEPSKLNVFVAKTDGTNARQITDLPGANWAPFFHPDGKRVLFCSNHESPPGGRPIFSIYMINLDGSGLTKISHSNTFDAFPMFSYDGKRIVFASNRNISRTPSRDTNVFVADWIETPEEADVNFKGWK